MMRLLSLNPRLKRGDWHKSLMPQWIKKYPLNLWVKLGFSETTAKPISGTLRSHLNLGFRLLLLVAAFGVNPLLAEEISATIRWAEISTISTPLSGRISTIKVQVGDAVKKDALLATLDPRPWRAALKRAQAEVARLQGDLKDVQREYDRAKELFDRTVLSTTALQTAETRFNVASATLQRAEADLELARLDLEYSQLRAPFTGVITERNINNGETVANRCNITPMIRIARTGDLLAVAKITPQQAEALQSGQQLIVRVDGESYQGIVRYIKPTLNNPALLELAVVFTARGGLVAGQRAVVQLAH